MSSTEPWRTSDDQVIPDQVTQVLSGASAVRRLHVLGLQPDWLQDAAESGMASRATATPHHPQGAAGTLQYLGTARALRDVLIPRGWTIERPNNLELTVHPADVLAIAISAGNEHTARRDGTPATKNEKGGASARVVAGNQLLLWSRDDDPESGDRPTYFLLYHADDDEGLVRCELALPTSILADGHVGEWRERIIWPQRRSPLDTIERIDEDVEAAGLQDFDVKVARRRRVS